MTAVSAPPTFGAIIIGDEILSGRREDKHLRKLIELLGARGLSLAYAQVLGDDSARITRALRSIFQDSCDVVFSFGGIGATPDDHTRQCAAAALNAPLALHAEAKTLIELRMAEMARDQGKVLDLTDPDSQRRLQMGEFPVSAEIIPNPYNRIPGFTCQGAGGATVHFVPGFPVMAWPMVEWVLDTRYAAWFTSGTYVEHSVIVYGALEATLTPLMERIEHDHAGVKVFSLPSVDHPVHGKHIELGVKGAVEIAQSAYVDLRHALGMMGLALGPEMVRP